jgi:glucose-6-phosphate 1-dehydrogenase
MKQLVPSPCMFVMFGATGDLMHRKLLPALYNLFEEKRLPKGFQVLGVSRDQNLTDAQFRKWGVGALKDAGFKDSGKLARWCNTTLQYQTIAQGSETDYQALGERIAAVERAHSLSGNRVMYLALPPGAFPSTIEGLGEAGLNRSHGWTRLAIEKPFGRDLTSARALNALIHRYFDETQVYRGDHYLGKESVQNLLAFRFGNALFESAWNRDHVKDVQITVAEELGVENRAAYYEETGALRDMVQNHLTQLLTLTAMEVPAAFQADAIRAEKIKVLHSVAPLRANAVVYGQYDAGKFQGRKLTAYRKAPGVAAKSNVETFVAMRLEIENWRWQGVPFFLRTGKRLAKRTTEIAINFRRPPVALFRSIDAGMPHTNVLVITLQPDEGFELSFEVKSPGDQFTLQTQRMKFLYAEAFGNLSTGYETLLLEIMQGDQTLFVHGDEAEAAWRLYTPLLRKPPPLHLYPAGSWGPAAAEKLVRTADSTWTTT